MTEFSKAYGSSLYALAVQEQLEARILEDLALVASAFETAPDYVKLLDMPSVLQAEKCSLLTQAFAASVHPYTLNLLKILAEKKQACKFSAVQRVFVENYNRAHNIEPATVVTAVPLEAHLYEKLKVKLEAMTGKTIVLENKIDPAILGGMTVRLANKQIDASVRSRLQKLEKQLTTNN